jgi:hypothetical protein
MVVVALVLWLRQHADFDMWLTAKSYEGTGNSKYIFILEYYETKRNLYNPSVMYIHVS